MKNNTETENRFESIRKMIDELPEKERKVISDQLLSYLLFTEFNNETFPLNKKKSIPTQKQGLAENELQLIKDLAKQTEKLRDLLGDDPYFFR